MEDGLLVSLSLDEEAILRQIAHGVANSRRFRERDLERVKQLGLVEQCRTGLGLTAIGEQRVRNFSGARAYEE